MDEMGGNENYGLKLLLGCIIGIIIVLFLVPLGANIIATEQVADAANNALNNHDTSSLSIPVDTSKFDAKNIPVTNNTTNQTNMTNQTNTTNNESDNQTNNTPINDDNNQPDNEPADLTNMRIISGSISTGSGLEDKSVCTIYVGEEYAGQTIQMSTLYSRDGTDLNAGRLVTKTVDSSGYVTLPAAESYELYPSNCIISIYDINGNELDSKSVNLATESGTQSF